MRKAKRYKAKNSSLRAISSRIRFIVIFFLIFGAGVFLQLARIQILHHKVYATRAKEQYNAELSINPKRGEIFWQDFSNQEVLPLVINKPIYHFYVVPKNILTPLTAAELLQTVLQMDQIVLLEKLSLQDDPYERLKINLSEKEKEYIKLRLKESGQSSGLVPGSYGFDEEYERFYVEKNLASHITGFLGFSNDGTARRGQYGLEEYFNLDLAGIAGTVLADQDVTGRPIAIGERFVEQVEEGTDIKLTVDKNIQYKACSLLAVYVKKYGAESGAVIIMDPINGKIMALCGNPDYDPNNYGRESEHSFINQSITESYEPGSIFKPITMAAALDTGSLTPWTTYNDKGSLKIGKYTIKNSDGKSHGISTMIEVLDKSLNTGAIFALRSVGQNDFKKYVEDFGFGKLTGIELASEVPGNIKPLENKSEIYFATASFGQGITATPIQLLSAYAAIARGGRLVKPTIVESVIKDYKETVFKARELNRVISEETASTLSMMLVSSVQNGYAKHARVDGYRIAGKTGTAQIPKKDGPGYSEETIHSFIGFGPVGDMKPVFVMLVKLDRPTEVEFSSDSAAPLFGEIAEFLLSYLEIPTDE